MTGAPANATGIIPVMLTPFSAADGIDWDGCAALIDWCLAMGAEALFAVCQSSEMQFLSLDERVALASFTVRHVAGRAPVVASGHVAETPGAQLAELRAMAGTGIDALVLVTNRLAMPESAGRVDDAAMRAALEALMRGLPDDLPLGLYECPAPQRVLLSDEMLKFCAGSGRFSFLKDVSCDLAAVARRVALTRDTPLKILNANAAIAWPAMQAGARGFCGVMNNFHPDLYRWLQDHGARHAALADELAAHLALAAMIESQGYPVVAKIFHQRRGTFGSIHSRAVTFDIRERHWALDALLDHLAEGDRIFRARIAALG